MYLVQTVNIGENAPSPPHTHTHTYTKLRNLQICSLLSGHIQCVKMYVCIPAHNTPQEGDAVYIDIDVRLQL